MFVSDEMLLETSFAQAQARLANLSRRGLLTTASEEAYGDGITGLARVGPAGPAPLASRLVSVHFYEPVIRGDSAVFPLRWQAISAGGQWFPALDADLILAPAGERVTMLRLEGTYRPPLGSLGARLDRMILHRVADATMRSFVRRVGHAIAHPAPAAEPGPASGWLEPELP